MNKYSKILLPTFYIGIVMIMVLCVMLVISGVKSFVNGENDLKYTLDNVFESDVLPVSKTANNSIIRPFLSENVKVGKYFYDFESKEEEKQQNSLIFFEDTYMQNNGVDYVNDDVFDVLSILDGEVISIDENEIYGKVVTIKHNDNLKSVYSNITDVLVNVGYKISQGEIFAKSSKSKINTEYNSMLHFEVYYKDNVIDPENMYTMSVSDFE